MKAPKTPCDRKSFLRIQSPQSLEKSLTALSVDVRMLSPGSVVLPVSRGLYSALARAVLWFSRPPRSSKSRSQRSSMSCACCHFVKVFFTVLEICSAALLGVVRALSVDSLVPPICPIPPSQCYRARVVLWFIRPSESSRLPPTRRRLPYAA